jgi:undecaprenyl-diphosphatase
MAGPDAESKTWRPLRAVARYLGATESLVLIFAFCVVAGVLAFIQVADEMVEGETQHSDEQVLLWFRQAGDTARVIGPAWAGEAACDLSSLGSAPVLALVVVLVAGFFFLARKAPIAWLVILAPLSGVILSTLLKGFFHRGRPSVVPHLDVVSSASFPSGHSMMSAIVYLTLGGLLARVVRRRRLKVYALTAAMLLAFLVGLSRVVLGVHYPSDVLAGWAAGLTWAFLWQLAAHGLARAKHRSSTVSTV